MGKFLVLLLATALIAVFSFILGLACDRADLARNPGQQKAALDDIQFCAVVLVTLAATWVGFGWFVSW